MENNRTTPACYEALRNFDLAFDGSSPTTIYDDARIAETSLTLESSSSSKLACPYYKVHGEIGALKRSCRGDGFPDPHRLKEHIYRVHKPSMKCPRCCCEFQDQAEINTHLRSINICGLMPESPIDSRNTFTEAQRQDLRKRPTRSAGSMSDEQQCRDVYGVLFPSEPLPESFCKYRHLIEPRLFQGFYGANEMYFQDISGPISRPKQNLRELILNELGSVLEELLQNPEAIEGNYADAGHKLRDFVQTMHQSGVVAEATNAAKHATSKRRRVSQEQADPFLTCNPQDLSIGRGGGIETTNLHPVTAWKTSDSVRVLHAASPPDTMASRSSTRYSTTSWNDIQFDGNTSIFPESSSAYPDSYSQSGSVTHTKPTDRLDAEL